MPAATTLAALLPSPYSPQCRKDAFFLNDSMLAQTAEKRHADSRAALDQIWTRRRRLMVAAACLILASPTPVYANEQDPRL